MRRVAAAVTALFTLLAAAPVAGASTSVATTTYTTTTSTTRPALAGVTKIRGSHTAVIPVRLTRPAVFYAYPRNSVQVRGKGKLAGLVLVEDEPGFDRINIIAGRFIGPRGAKQFAHSAGLDEDVVPSAAPKWRLPAGNYRLYLITDGKPVTVRLELGRLDGTRQLYPTSGVQFELQTPPIQRIPQGMSAGADHFLPGQGMAFAVLATDYELLAQDETRTCYYVGAPPEENAYGPTCPNQVGASYGTTEPMPMQFGFTSSVSPLPRGRYGKGFYNAHVGLLDGATYAQFWMSFN